MSPRSPDRDATSWLPLFISLATAVIAGAIGWGRIDERLNRYGEDIRKVQELAQENRNLIVEIRAGLPRD